MEINIQIPIHVRSVIEKHLGQTVEEMAAVVITTRINSLFKRYGPRRLPGRPGLNEEERRFKDLSKSLIQTFADLKEVSGEDYQVLYGDLERKLNEAIDQKNRQVLEWFSQHEPWRSSPDKIPNLQRNKI